MNLKDKLLTVLSQSNLHPVGETGFFVKVFTVKELDEIIKINKQFANDGFEYERNLAFELYDAKGERLFDPLNVDDLLLLRQMPASFYFMVKEHVNEANSHAFFQQQMSPNPNSTPETDSSLN